MLEKSKYFPNELLNIVDVAELAAESTGPDFGPPAIFRYCGECNNFYCTCEQKPKQASESPTGPAGKERP